MGILDFIKGIFSPVADVYNNHQERKVKLQEAKDKVVLAKLAAEENRYLSMQESVTNWDIEAMRQSQFSWKDEVLMIIVFLPFVGAFFPVVQDYVRYGFDIVSELPLWYQLSLVGIIAASFGLRWLFQGKISKVIK